MKRKKQNIKTAQQRVYCPHCGAIATIRPASEIYRDPNATGELYVCSNFPRCNSYVGVHPGTRLPLGVLANGDVRNLRIKAHRRLDKIWQYGIMTRQESYAWLAAKLGIRLRDTHIGMFGEYMCKAVIRECDAVLANYEATQGKAAS